jgi:S-disulfanyl-L-cysteine oxidoreductase SoxD
MKVSSLILGSLVCLALAGTVALASSSPGEQAAEPGAQATSAPSRTVWNGIYSTAQAARGKEQFDGHCIACHGEDLSGTDEGPGLTGDIFLNHWLEDNLDALFTKIETRMPANAPNSLTGAAYADLLAYLLESNGFPAGAGELTPNHAELATIQIVGKDGPRPVPDFSLVQVVGCLKAGTGNAWLVSKGTEPARVREPGAASAAEKEAAEAKTLGSQTFHLFDITQSGLDGYRDRRVLVRGFLVRQPDESRLNVTSIGPIAGACPAD